MKILKSIGFITILLLVVAQFLDPEKNGGDLDSYTWAHAEANLTQDQIDEIVTWAKKVKVDYEQQLKQNN